MAETKYKEGDQIQVTLLGTVYRTDNTGFPQRVAVTDLLSIALERSMKPEIKLIKRAVKPHVMYFDPRDNTIWWMTDDISRSWYCIQRNMSPVLVPESHMDQRRFMDFKELVPED